MFVCMQQVLQREGYSVVIVKPIYTIGELLATGFRIQQDVPDPQHLIVLARNFFNKDVTLHVGIEKLWK